MNLSPACLVRVNHSMTTFLVWAKLLFTAKHTMNDSASLVHEPLSI